MTNTALPAIPSPTNYMTLLDECLARIAAAQSGEDLDALRNEWAGRTWNSFTPGSQEAILAAGKGKRAALADAISDRLIGTVSTETPPSANAVAEAITIVQDLNVIAAASVAAPARRGRPVGSRNVPRAMTQAEISAAILTARANGAKLAGYDGQVVAPGEKGGIGTVITLGGSIAEYDAVSDRNRQVLIPWSDVENVRTVCGLPVGAFGRAPGLVGILGDATQILNHGGFVARKSKSGGKYASAWKIGYFDNRIDSDSLGRKEALITLAHDGTIACDSPDHPGAALVLADYDRRVAATLIPSDDLARRVAACLRNYYSARHTDLGIFVPPFASPRAVDLVVALRPIAGRRIYASAYTDRATMGEALTDSLMADLAKLETDCTEGKIGAGTLLARGERLRVEASGLGSILGDAYEGIKARLMACDAMAVSKMDERAANLELT